MEAYFNIFLVKQSINWVFCCCVFKKKIIIKTFVHIQWFSVNKVR